MGNIINYITPVEVLRYSAHKQLTHIPSALSMLNYVDVLFTDEFVIPYQHKIVIGKPFGAQTYYLIWKKLKFLNAIEHLSVGVKHGEIDFVDYGEETMGNALGVAAGIAITTPQKVWVNLSDATLQMGSTLEAIQFIGHKQLKNIILTVDFNNVQVTGKTSDIIPVTPVINFFRDNNWTVIIVNGHNYEQLKSAFSTKTIQPVVFICNTIKGHGCSFMEADPVLWHYKKLDESYA